jgi:glycosyltransferase involved in cell wall biosynthesis
MHVVIATGLYPPEIGGPATFAAFFEKGLKEKNVPCTIVPFSTVRRLPKIIRHFDYFIRVARATRRGDIVLALDPVSVGLPALFAAKMRHASFYLRAGGDYAWEQAAQRWSFRGLPEEFPGSARLPLAGKLLVAVERFVARRARRILTQSGHLASIIARWGVARDRIVVIPNGVTVEELPPREKLREEFGWKGPVVFSAGRFVPWKGFEAVMDAVASLKRDLPEVRLCIAGTGPYEAGLRNHALRLNVPVHFLGTLSKSSLMHAMHAADVFVLNTRYEGFSHQIAEAFAVGIPVVTTNIPGNHELAQDGRTALLVKWNDVEAIRAAIEKLLGDKELSARMAESAKRHVATFTPARSFRETCEALGIEAGAKD